MVVGIVCNGKVLGLSEQVITAQGEGDIVVEEELGNLCIQHALGRLRSGIDVVPVVVGISGQGHSD